MSTQDEGRERGVGHTWKDPPGGSCLTCRTGWNTRQGEGRCPYPLERRLQEIADRDEGVDMRLSADLARWILERLRTPTARSTPPVAWRPIETAPKDGTKILATGVGLGRWIDVVWWFKGKWRDEGKGYLMGISHWMPLPVSPDAHPVPEDTESAEVERLRKRVEHLEADNRSMEDEVIALENKVRALNRETDG